MSGAPAIPPPTRSEINLAIADTVLNGILFPFALWLVWKHGKVGIVCWPIFASYFVIRFVADAYQIVHDTESDIPNAVSLFTNAGSLACLSLSIIGIIYEANSIIPSSSKRWLDKAVLGYTHLFNTAGIGMATYGGSPSSTGQEGVKNHLLNKIGNGLMLFVIFVVFFWLFASGRRVLAAKSHPNQNIAKRLHFAACAAVPFQLVRLMHSATYAFNRIPSLDPVMGTFATKLVLVIGMQIGVSIALTVGGWMTRSVTTRLVAVQTQGTSDRDTFLTTMSEPTKAVMSRHTDASGKGLVIIHVALFRMGTRSLAEAYKILGYKVHHGMDDVFGNPYNLLEQAAESTWPRVPGARPRAKFERKDWDGLWGSDYDIATDLSSPFADQLIEAYPDAKVIIVQRNFETWWPSYREIILDAVFPLVPRVFLYLEAVLLGFRAGPAMTKIHLGFFGANSREEIEANTRNSYDEYYRKIRSMVPPERRLEYKIGDGWEPLCEFLGKEIPNVPFPRMNDRDAYHKANLESLQSLAASVARKAAPWLFLGVTTATAYAWSRGR
ncbi:putative efflux pump antibiotic resistance protein [Paramyrothecium foliicola]|nr:putative efflux pump antibiotic resistance protein [Paramyrothecium foliicola]